MDKILEIMLNEYREVCRDHYETVYGEKVSTKWKIVNQKTGEIISGSTSGRHDDDAERNTMLVIRRMIIRIFGDQVADTLTKIRKEELKKEKMFFKENPQYIVYVTDIR